MKYFLYLLTASLFVFSACQDTDDLDSDTSTTADYAIANAAFEDVKQVADDAQDGGTGIGGRFAGCADFKLDTTTPNQMIIDFGLSNCQGIDGKQRRGKVIVNWTGPYWEEGTVITHTFDNYFVNDYQLLGSKTVTNRGQNSQGNLFFAIVDEGSVVKPNGRVIEYSSNRVRTMVEGQDTPRWIIDDKYEITGRSEGKSSGGTSFTANIVEPLVVEVGCPFVIQGVLDIEPSGKVKRTVDYGEGECDTEVTIIIAGGRYTIFI